MNFETLIDLILLVLLVSFIEFNNIKNDINKFTIPTTGITKVERFYLLYYIILFILLNSILSVITYLILDNSRVFNYIPDLLEPTFIAILYLSIIHQKIGKTVDNNPIGMEAFYLKFKDILYDQINKIVKRALVREIKEWAYNQSLNEIEKQLKYNINSDSLIGRKTQSEEIKYIDEVINDSSLNNFEKKQILAHYSIQRSDNGVIEAIFTPLSVN